MEHLLEYLVIGIKPLILLGTHTGVACLCLLSQGKTAKWVQATAWTCGSYVLFAGVMHAYVLK